PRCQRSVPDPLRQARGIRGPRAPHHREHHDQWRSHPPRRRAQDGAEIAREKAEMTKIRVLIAAATALIAFVPAAYAAPAKVGASNIVLVHGALVDGSGWRAVYEVLKKEGYRVSIVQEPLTSLDDDVA